VKSTNHEAPQYVTFFILLLLPLRWVQILSSTLPFLTGSLVLGHLTLWVSASPWTGREAFAGAILRSLNRLQVQHFVYTYGYKAVTLSSEPRQ